jgi:hypothetical protein
MCAIRRFWLPALMSDRTVIWSTTWSRVTFISWKLTTGPRPLDVVKLKTDPSSIGGSVHMPKLATQRKQLALAVGNGYVGFHSITIRLWTRTGSVSEIAVLLPLLAYLRQFSKCPGVGRCEDQQRDNQDHPYRNPRRIRNVADTFRQMRGLGQKQSDADRDKQKIEGDQCPHPGKQTLYVDHDSWAIVVHAQQYMCTLRRFTTHQRSHCFCFWWWW